MFKLIGATFFFFAFLGTCAASTSEYKYAYQCKDSLTGKSAGMVEFGSVSVKFDGSVFSTQVQAGRGAYHGKPATKFVFVNESAAVLTMFMVDNVEGVYLEVFGDEFVCNKLIR